MIIRALVKAVVFVAFTPIPEYVHILGRVASVGALALAGNADTEATYEEEPNPFYYEGSDEPPTKMKPVHTDTAGDVWMKLLPLSDDFSIRDAIKTYNGLNREQKDIFLMSAFAAGCEAFYVIHSLARVIRLDNDRTAYKNAYIEADSKRIYAIDRLNRQAEIESGVLNWYDRNHAIVDWSIEAEKANYSNVSGSVAFLKELAGDLGGSAA